MANLASIRCGFYRIPLPVVLSDSTHGEMRAFELNTVRLTDAEGAEGVGYTYTAGRNGAAVHAILEREIAELFGGEEADEIERIWRKAWWALHYGGRGGPTVLAISAFDMALWDLKAKRARLPLWNFSADLMRECLAMPAVSISISPSTSCCGKPTIISPRDSAPSR